MPESLLFQPSGLQPQLPPGVCFHFEILRIGEFLRQVKGLVGRLFAYLLWTQTREIATFVAPLADEGRIGGVFL